MLHLRKSTSALPPHIRFTDHRDTWEVANFAKEYIVTNGPDDPVFQLYFGTDPASYVTAIGSWDSLLSSNKENVIFRCDNPDGNCALEGWNGHWRGENGSSETVICEASYVNRRYNIDFCNRGYQLASTKPSLYWSIDLIHRLFHVPAISNEFVDHFAENLEEVIELAAHNGSFAARDSNALQYFAAHVYANEIAQGGESCTGEIGHDHDHADDDHASTTTAAGATATTTAASECHTHADGTEHCV